MKEFSLGDGYVVDFPVWIAVIEETGMYTSMTDETLGPVFAYFSDEDLAWQFVDEQYEGGVCAVPIEAEMLRDLIEEAERGCGCKRVMVDGTGKRDLKSRVYEIGDFLNDLKAALAEEN